MVGAYGGRSLSKRLYFSSPSLFSSLLVPFLFFSSHAPIVMLHVLTQLLMLKVGDPLVQLVRFISKAASVRVSVRVWCISLLSPLWRYFSVIKDVVPSTSTSTSSTSSSVGRFSLFQQSLLLNEIAPAELLILDHQFSSQALQTLERTVGKAVETSR